MKSMSSRDIQLIEADGWFHVATKGSHSQFKHPSKSGRVTVPHPKKDLDGRTLRSIWRQAGIDPPP